MLLECKHRILDTFGAMVSGARMQPGEMALRYVRSQGGVQEASVIASDFRTTAVNAALANGMFGHADETDDFEPVTKAHPGCSVVPAALAIGERNGGSGMDMIRAVALGYDLCCRLLMALGPDHVRGTHRSAEGTSSTFGAVGGAAGMAKLDEDADARGAVLRRAAGLGPVELGARRRPCREGVRLLPAWARATASRPSPWCRRVSPAWPMCSTASTTCSSRSPRSRSPRRWWPDSARRYFVTESAIKTFSVGYPIQAPLDAFLTLRRQHNLTPANVEHILVRLPPDGATSSTTARCRT